MLGLRLRSNEGRRPLAQQPQRAAGLLGVGGVGSVVTARFGDAPPSPPCPHPKSLAAAPLLVCNQALKLAQVALSYGADDLHGTILEEHIFHMAGATSPQLQTEMEMVKAIRETRRTPVQRNTFYEPIKVWESAPTATEAEPPAGKAGPASEFPHASRLRTLKRPEGRPPET